MTYLSAWKVTDTSERYMRLIQEAWLGTPAIRLQPVETTSNGGCTTVFDGAIARTALSSKLFFDILVNVTGSYGSGALEILYKDQTPISIDMPIGTSGRQRMLITAPDPPPFLPDAVPLVIRAAAPDNGTIEAQPYWIDEISNVFSYTALDNVNALATGAKSTVGSAIDALYMNTVSLEQLLHRKGVAGYRPAELGFMGGETTQASTYRLKAGGVNGYLYILWGIYALKYKEGASITVTIKLNSATTVGTLVVDRNYGFSEKGFINELEMVDGLYPLASVIPAVLPQGVHRVDISATRVGDISARITPLFMCWVDSEGIGTFPRPQPGAPVTDLTSLYLVGRAAAGDDGTGYGKDGYDVAGGYPVGYAIIDGRSQAAMGHRTHSGFYADVINMEGSQYQVITFRHCGAPHLLVMGKGIEVYYMRENKKDHTMELDGIDSIDDAENGELLDISDMPMGLTYMVAADLTQNTEEAENYLTGAWEVYADV